MSFDIQYGLA